MLSHIDALTKSKLALGSEVEGSTEFDLMVDTIEVYCNYYQNINGELHKQIFYFDGLDLPYRTEENGSLLITLDEIASVVFEKTGKRNCKVFYESAFEGAVLLYSNDERKCWTLNGITNGFA
jgi:hypothetical protein